MCAYWADFVYRWDDEDVPRREPVVLVHGINTTDDTWHSVRPKLESYFSHYYRDEGDSEKPNTYVEAINYGGEKGEKSFQPIEASAGELKDFIKVVQGRYSGSDVNLLCHSLGGLVAKKYLSEFRGKEILDYPPVRRYITLGTPHKGTWWATGAVAMIEAGRLPWVPGFNFSIKSAGRLINEYGADTFLGRFVVQGKAYGKKGALYAMQRNKKYAWDRDRIHVREAVFVSFPGDMIVSETSQKAFGMDSLPYAVRMEGPPGVGHIDETAQLNIMVKALDGIKTFRFHSTGLPLDLYDLRLSEVDRYNTYGIVIVDTLGGDLDAVTWRTGTPEGLRLPDPHRIRDEADFKSKIPQLFLSKTGVIKVRYRAALLSQHEYLPASSDGKRNGTVMNVAVQRYRSIHEIPSEFPNDAEFKTFNNIVRYRDKRVSLPGGIDMVQFGLASGEMNIGYDADRPYVAMFMQAENPGGLKSETNRGVFETVPSIVPLVRALNERQEMFEEATFRPLVQYKFRQLNRDATKGDPDGGRSYPGKHDMDGVRVYGTEIRSLYDGTSQLFEKYIDIKSMRMTTINRSTLFHRLGIGDGFNWTIIPDGEPGGPSFFQYGAASPVFPVHFEELSKVLNSIQWISLAQIEDSSMGARLYRGYRRSDGYTYASARQTHYSEWQSMENRGRSQVPDARISIAGGTWQPNSPSFTQYMFDLDRVRTALRFEVPDVSRTASEGKIVLQGRTTSNLSSPLRAISVNSWPIDYDAQGLTLAEIPYAQHAGGVTYHVLDMPEHEFKDYFVKLAFSDNLETPNPLPVSSEGSSKTIEWQGSVRLLLNIDFQYPQKDN